MCIADTFLAIFSDTRYQYFFHTNLYHFLGFKAYIHVYIETNPLLMVSNCFLKWHLTLSRGSGAMSTLTGCWICLWNCCICCDAEEFLLEARSTYLLWWFLFLWFFLNLFLFGVFFFGRRFFLRRRFLRWRFGFLLFFFLLLFLLLFLQRIPIQSKQLGQSLFT